MARSRERDSFAASHAGQARQTLPDLERRLAQQRNLLTASRTLSFAGVGETSTLRICLAHELPLSLPAQLVGQRPDIKAPKPAFTRRAPRWRRRRGKAAQYRPDANGGLARYSSRSSSRQNLVYTLMGNVAQPVFDA